ncbi:MAG: sulfite exporter TauE/SafE family protein [Alphaproteobacteria bacterium]|nr:sulfite exporter TauE/SafE family protein [Alphaproteobacteria bacterium]MBU0795606.1 sulfite exporter TauE/SafE family protein [Alphaproteobacteria bacterium]MBU0887663.1 sulfite exporter TauE/SafE family protein [Alphaproteobacteria bacterium]MBU1812910.1 sulfite exporter TauE/SafE family protein [Alphaproteobacteria bacterium]
MTALLPEALTPLSFALVFLVVTFAAVVRAFTGFGFALLAIPALVLILPPTQVVPFIFILEIGISMILLPHLWREVDMRGLRWLLPGALIATPFGGLLLLALSAEALRLGIGLVVLSAALLMWRGLSFRKAPGPLAALATGGLSGILNGAAGIPGPPVVLFYLSTPAANAVSRASLIAYFAIIDILGVAVAAYNGLVDGETLRWVLWLVPATVLGSVIGQYAFRRANPGLFRPIVLLVLLATGLAGAVKAMLDILA